MSKDCPLHSDQVDYLTEDHDFSDTECEKQPNIEYINSMLRNIAPSFSNNYIEQAYGNGGCLVQNAPQDLREKISPKKDNESHNNSKEQNLASDLNPCIKEFVPREECIPRKELGPGDFIPQSKTIQQHSPKKCPEADHSPQHNLNHNNSEYNSLSADMDNASILSLDSLSDEEYLDAESYDCIRTVFEEEKVVESVTKNVPADHKENTMNTDINSAPLKASPLADRKLKRNCALQSMFDRFAQGETQFNNIEVNQKCFANLCVAQSPTVISKPSDATDQVIDFSDDSSQNSYNSNQFVDSKDSSTSPPEPLQDFAGCLNPKSNLDTLDPKSKVAAWLSTDDSQRFATQQLNIVPPPKPKPMNLCDDAFAFKVKNTNVVKGKTSMECTKNMTEMKQKHEEKETDKPQPKGKMSVEEIYNRLKANQGKPSATTSVPKTFENFVKVESVQQTSSNTLWDNIENAMHKKVSNKKPRKWQKLM